MSRLRRRARRLLKPTTSALALTAALLMPAVLLGTMPSASAPAPALSTRLLGLAQMPKGWRVVNLSSGRVGCLGNLLQPKGIEQTASAGTNFSAEIGTPVVEEKLATFKNATVAYGRIVADVGACKHFSGSLSGQKLTGGTVVRIAFPGYGSSSEAFAVRYTIVGTTVHEDLLVVLRNTIVMGISEGNYGAVNAVQLEGLVKLATAKLG